MINYWKGSPEYIEKEIAIYEEQIKELENLIENTKTDSLFFDYIYIEILKHVEIMGVEGRYLIRSLNTWGRAEEFIKLLIELHGLKNKKMRKEHDLIISKYGDQKDLVIKYQLENINSRIKITAENCSEMISLLYSEAPDEFSEIINFFEVLAYGESLESINITSIQDFDANKFKSSFKPERDINLCKILLNSLEKLYELKIKKRAYEKLAEK